MNDVFEDGESIESMSDFVLDQDIDPEWDITRTYDGLKFDWNFEKTRLFMRILRDQGFVINQFRTFREFADVTDDELSLMHTIFCRVVGNVISIVELES